MPPPKHFSQLPEVDQSVLLHLLHLLVNRTDGLIDAKIGRTHGEGNYMHSSDIVALDKEWFDENKPSSSLQSCIYNRVNKWKNLKSLHVLNQMIQKYVSLETATHSLEDVHEKIPYADPENIASLQERHNVAHRPPLRSVHDHNLPSRRLPMLSQDQIALLVQEAAFRLEAGRDYKHLAQKASDRAHVAAERAHEAAKADRDASERAREAALADREASERANEAAIAAHKADQDAAETLNLLFLSTGMRPDEIDQMIYSTNGEMPNF